MFPALLSLKILVVGPSPALWLPNAFITRLRDSASIWLTFTLAQPSRSSA